ncbi:MAG: ChaN family lipoprotein [Phycisphaerae bacterium]
MKFAKRLGLFIFAQCGIILGTGCASFPARQPAGADATGSGKYRIVHARTGRHVNMTALARACRKADVVFFGEQHYDAICSAAQLDLLEAWSHPGAAALSMEFFDRDTQPDVDAYLAGRISEAEFLTATKRDKKYATSHRPLLEYCRTHHHPVIAANAPRALVRGYRNAGLPYAEYRKTLPAAEKRWLPVAFDQVSGSYEKSFREAMQHHAANADENGIRAVRAAAHAQLEPPPVENMTEHLPGETKPAMPSVEQMFQAQLLWDNSMAEAIANFRNCFPAQPVLHIVGAFHVRAQGATAEIYHRRRPQDQSLTIVYETEAADGSTWKPDPAVADYFILGLSNSVSGTAN